MHKINWSRFHALVVLIIDHSDDDDDDGNNNRPTNLRANLMK